MSTKYNNAKIYKISSPHFDKFYIGSTTISLNSRLAIHKNDMKKHEDGKKNFVTSYLVLKHSDCKIELIETFSCANRKELEKREGYYQILHKHEIVNTCQAGRTKAEYDIMYRATNMAKIADYKKLKVQCECGIEVIKANYSRHCKTIKHTLHTQNNNLI